MNIWNEFDWGAYRYINDGSSVTTEMRSCDGTVIAFRRFTETPEKECIEHILGWNRGYEEGAKQALALERKRIARLLGLE